jgi:hypothetical protein
MLPALGVASERSTSPSPSSSSSSSSSSTSSWLEDDSLAPFKEQLNSIERTRARSGDETSTSLFLLEASNEERHTRDVAVVFAGLVGTTQDHIVDVGGVDAAARNDRFEHRGGKVVGTYARERAAVATEGGAQRLNDPGLL